MFEEIKNTKSGKKELRQFGIAVGIVLGLLGGWFFLRGKDCYFLFLMFSAGFLFLGLVLPILLKPIQKIWMAVALLIGWLITRIILILLFYLVVTPIRILAMILGKCFLDKKFDRNTDSYWMRRETAGFDKESYEKQF